jgi:sugar transferase (PEP-CTERM system associated)
MVRLFNVYYPTRMILLLVCEAIIVSSSFLIAAALVLGPNMYIAMNYEMGAQKIAGLTVLTILCSYYFDLYAPQRIPFHWEIYFRLLLVLGLLSFILAGGSYLFPKTAIGPNVFVLGLAVLTVALFAWRRAYEWIIGRSAFSERVYVLGCGERAQQIVDAIGTRRDFGMEVVGWGGASGVHNNPVEDFASALKRFRLGALQIDRVIVALQDRRGAMPVRELLDIRLAGVNVEDAGSLLEKMSGKLQLEGLHPSALIFAEGFRVKPSQQFFRRIVSMLVSATGLALCLPIIPFIALVVKLSSPGPILFRQNRVGLRGKCFVIYKFRTMGQDAEARGAVWAKKNDPRITRVGMFLRKTRLDEIPQLWNVLRGDMGFVGPRPERPEFVQWLADQIPYYNLRHTIRPGLTGWAQVRYQYGASVEETKQKLEYDLYYIKHMTSGLDLLIMFETIKTILLRRGAQ